MRYRMMLVVDRKISKMGSLPDCPSCPSVSAHSYPPCFMNYHVRFVYWQRMVSEYMPAISENNFLHCPCICVVSVLSMCAVCTLFFFDICVFTNFYHNKQVQHQNRIILLLDKSTASQCSSCYISCKYSKMWVSSGSSKATGCKRKIFHDTHEWL